MFFKKKAIILLCCILLFAASDLFAAETKVITPNDAFAAADLAERCADLLLEAAGIKNVKLLKKKENGIK